MLFDLLLSYDSLLEECTQYKQDLELMKQLFGQTKEDLEQTKEEFNQTKQDLEHTKEDLDFAVECFAKVKKEMRL